MISSWMSPWWCLKPIWQKLRAAANHKNLHGRVGLEKVLPLPNQQLPQQLHLTLLVLGNLRHVYRQLLRGNSRSSQPLPMYQRRNNRSRPSRTTKAWTPPATMNIKLLPTCPWLVVQPQQLRLRRYHFRTSSSVPRHQHRNRHQISASTLQLGLAVENCLLNRHMIDGHRSLLVPVTMNNHIAHLLHMLAQLTSLPGE